MSRLVLSLVFISSATFARFCVHDQKGSCLGHDIWGWCFHNKTSGRFDCDDDGFCASQEQLKNKKSSGCFMRANSSVCCCNEADGCNLGFIQVAPKYAFGQQCTNSIEFPGEDTRQFRPCDDPYCYSILSSDEDGGPTTVIRGCHSRKLVLHNMFKAEDAEFKNNTKWKETEQLASLPVCSDVLRHEPSINGTRRLCVDFSYDQQDEDGEVIKMKSRFCCCDGAARCNDNLLWGTDGVTLQEMEETIKQRRVAVSAAIQFSPFILIASLIGFLYF
ncbi:unnamed protein product [Caenorhabditis bovis]|uniref:Uncharacterized protein n=1 Tax=Caenorhabditis bovis TaxID=2654633 RepID=A0A8S1F602_9PELO|nr:unnamed protein product [Caenorhabditis bovis]